MSRRLIAVAAIMAAEMNTLPAGSLAVPNASFESPPTGYVNINIDFWQKTPKPDWYVEGGGYAWDQLTGFFKNTTLGSFDHIDNCHGNQAAWLQVVPEVGFFQDYDSVDWNDASPSHAFNAKFDAGNSYQLTVGVIGGGGGMKPGATLELRLYYRDGESNRMTVAATAITNSLAVFPTNTHLIDFTVSVPTVKASDAWAGQNIGILLLSTISTNSGLEGGYWDLDNVRLSSIRAPVLLSPARTNGQFSFILQSEPGLAFDILSTTDIALPSSNWINLGPLTNVTGTVPFVDTAPNLNQRFYRARQIP
jgi:hypothetical protein